MICLCYIQFDIQISSNTKTSMVEALLVLIFNGFFLNIKGQHPPLSANKAAESFGIVAVAGGCVNTKAAKGDMGAEKLRVYGKRIHIFLLFQTVNRADKGTHGGGHNIRIYTGAPRGGIAVADFDI